MKQLPNPETYEKEILYMPWGVLVKDVLELTINNAKKDGKVLDLMCGPGQLLSKIKEKRRDLLLTGVDIDKRYIEFALANFPDINFIYANALDWKTEERFDTILITGGVHHVPYEKKKDIIIKIASLLAEDGFCVLADPFVDDYANEKERRSAAAKLGYEYIKAVLEKDAPDEIVSASIDILANDVLPNGEYKTSISKMIDLLKPVFTTIEIRKTWPEKDSEYGDYYFILKK